MNQDRIDILISRIVDAEATAEEWSELAASAQLNHAIWSDLAEAQRQHRALARAGAALVNDAVRVNLPDGAPAMEARTARAAARRSVGRPWLALLGWGGWAVAACAALAWGLAWPQREQALPAEMVPNGVAAIPVSAKPASAEEAWAAYLARGIETGRVVAEVPERVLLEARPSSKGQGYDVVYLRQVMERASVPDLFELRGRDEAGRPTLIRYDDRPGGPM